ncbi:TIGR03618 family F420-dependent PPOX class oxidoreductase [Streptomyces krungchingensis]|uniref:TIGR03618 family F420-dependent PPOX class oxidoreductase n=1 Tax=Streptomyces krungchingensis TaxID=1565034 RepID=UPI003CE6D2BE
MTTTKAYRMTEPVRRALTSGRLAHMVTLNPDGSPQVACVWVGLDEEDRIVSGHLYAQQKIRNLRRDPRVALSMAAGVRSPEGMEYHFVAHGIAEVLEGGAVDLLGRIAAPYLEAGRTWPADRFAGATGFVVRTTVDRVTGFGPWD